MAHWYYGENGMQIGPLDEDAIRAAISEGRVNQQTLVWREGMASWLPLANVAELASPHGMPVYYGPTSGPMIGRSSGLAVASMICGITGIATCFFLFGMPSIGAVICGHMALHSIANSPVPLSGRGMAIAGLVTGYLMILSMIGLVIAVVIGSVKP